jgi:hypothetical protein
MGDARRLDRADLRELHLRGVEVVEQPGAVAQQDGHDVKLELVQESRRKVLIHDFWVTMYTGQW